MKRLAQKVSVFLCSDDGSNAVHIVILLAVVAIFCLAVFSSLSTSTPVPGP